MGEENIPLLKQTLGWKWEEEFFVPDEVREEMKTIIQQKKQVAQEWQKKYEEYEKAEPALARELNRYLERDIPTEFLESEEMYSFEKDMATRASSGIVLNRLAEKIPQLMGGSADLGPSNKSEIKGEEFFGKDHYENRNIHFGVREHAMAAMMNGMALHGGVIPYCATFFVFSDYLKPSIRLSALMNLGVPYILTHDSIGVGEDGPTHQPIEQLAMLRTIPNVSVFRPCDAKETAAAWSFAIEKDYGPTALVLTRQNLRNLPETGKDAKKGAYVLKDLGDKLDIILMASGSEVSLIYDAADKLFDLGYGVRVVSMPSMETFELQEKEYKERVLPKEIQKRISVEALSTFGWGRYVGFNGISIGLDHFGASAPADRLFKEFGFTVEHIVEQAVNLLKE